jgi:hypothetical protein
VYIKLTGIVVWQERKKPIKNRGIALPAHDSEELLCATKRQMKETFCAGWQALQNLGAVRPRAGSGSVSGIVIVDVRSKAATVVGTHSFQARCGRSW